MNDIQVASSKELAASLANDAKASNQVTNPEQLASELARADDGNNSLEVQAGIGIASGSSQIGFDIEQNLDELLLEDPTDHTELWIYHGDPYYSKSVQIPDPTIQANNSVSTGELTGESTWQV